MRGRTLAGEVRLAGVGVHSGAVCAATIGPAEPGHGRTVQGVRVELEAARAVPGATVIGGVSTPEHLLAALVGLGVTDAAIAVEGPEVPILDGSSAPWCAALAEVGFAEGPEVAVLEVLEEVAWWDGERGGRWLPAERGEVAVDVDHGEAPWLRGHAEVALDGVSFAAEVAWARTFVHARDVAPMRAAGLGRGASSENTVLVGEATRPELRGPDEVVRHKLLDAVGDLALLGSPLRGRLEVTRGGHGIHQALIRALLDRTDAWRLTTSPPGSLGPRSQTGA